MKQGHCEGGKDCTGTGSPQFLLQPHCSASVKADPSQTSWINHLSVQTEGLECILGYFLKAEVGEYGWGDRQSQVGLSGCNIFFTDQWLHGLSLKRIWIPSLLVTPSCSLCVTQNCCVKCLCFCLAPYNWSFAFKVGLQLSPQTEKLSWYRRSSRDPTAPSSWGIGFLTFEEEQPDL